MQPKRRDMVNIGLRKHIAFQVFSEMISLEGLLTLMKIQSERYAEKNGKVFQTINNELNPFLVINILMGIDHLLSIKDYYSLQESLTDSLIPKVIKRAQFSEILQSMHLLITFRTYPQEVVSNMTVYGNSAPCLTTN